MTAKELVKLLRKHGWVEKDQKGTSHLKMIHPTQKEKGKITVSMHKGDIPIGTLRSILKQAGLK